MFEFLVDGVHCVLDRHTFWLTHCQSKALGKFEIDAGLISEVAGVMDRYTEIPEA